MVVSMRLDARKNASGCARACIGVRATHGGGVCLWPMEVACSGGVAPMVCGVIHVWCENGVECIGASPVLYSGVWCATCVTSRVVACIDVMICCTSLVCLGVASHKCGLGVAGCGMAWRGVA